MSKLTELRDMPYKFQRFLSLILTLVLVKLPLDIFHDLDVFPWYLSYAPAVIVGLLYAHYDEEILGEWVMKHLWVTSLVTALLMLPMSIVQSLTLGYFLVLVLALIISPLMVQLARERYVTHKEALEYMPGLRTFWVSDYVIVMPIITFIWLLLSFASHGEPLVVVGIWVLLVAFTLYSINQDYESTKSYLNSEKTQRRLALEREERELEEAKQLQEEDYHD